MKSMTAFARVEGNIAGCAHVLELKSVNHRFLDVNLHAPTSFFPLELKIQGLVKAHLTRGKIDLWIRPGQGLDPQNTTALLQSAKALGRFLSELQTESGLSGAPSLSHLLDIKELWMNADAGEAGLEKTWEDLSPLIGALLAKVTAYREEEGRFLAREFKKMGDMLGGIVERIEAQTPTLVAGYRERLAKRISGLLAGLPQGALPLDPGLLENEIALFAERSDTSEEICRLKCHLGRWQEHLGDKEAVGRRLDFLLQEMHREFNTIGAKCNDAQISQAVVESKLILEKMREQVQNIE